MVPTPPRIDLLPEHLIDQIKAGEVIERPGNLIKEIIENAIDAHASKIEIAIRENGLSLISIKDNGHGMRFSDLPIAFSRHATSKISRFEDLYKLNSFGFRGEALASIAAISKLQCISKIAGEKNSSELKIEGGLTIYHEQRQTQSFISGTELIIQDLFFNTPARLKFIQSQQSEKNFIKKIIFSFLLSKPNIEFQIKIDDAEKDIYEARSTLMERIKDIIPKAKDSISLTQREYDNIELDFFLIPGNFKAPVKIQNIHINNRYILDKQLHRLISNTLSTIFGDDNFHYLANFHLPADTIDVNVHPNKTIIKIMNQTKMMGVLSSTIKSITDKRTSDENSTSFIPQKNQSSSHGLLSTLDIRSDIQQINQKYNMEGIFSPHNVLTSLKSNYFWLDTTIVKNNGLSWIAISTSKLLEHYCTSRIKFESPTIPLLVSEPFSSQKIKPERIETLIRAGLEIEHLGPQTLVVRGIPEWMNGFPLKEVINCLLLERSFTDVQIHPNEWSESTWDEILSYFQLEELLKQKIILDLSLMLKENFK
jgi:DNA mismatch repair protein MutL